MEGERGPEEHVLADLVGDLADLGELLLGDLHFLDAAGKAFSLGPDGGLALVLGTEVDAEADGLLRDGAAVAESDVGLDGEGVGADAVGAERERQFAVIRFDEIVVHVDAGRVVDGGQARELGAHETGGAQVGAHGEVEAALAGVDIEKQAAFVHAEAELKGYADIGGRGAAGLAGEAERAGFDLDQAEAEAVAGDEVDVAAEGRCELEAEAVRAAADAEGKMVEHLRAGVNRQDEGRRDTKGDEFLHGYFPYNYARVKDKHLFRESGFFAYFCGIMKGVNIFLADGFEDVEALATNDVLRRGGVATRLVALTDDPQVESSHGILVTAEAFLPELDANHAGTTAEDVMIFPGGMPGSKALAACSPLIALMRAHYAAGGSVAAICAAPGLVLSQLEGVWQGQPFTCFDGFEDALIALGGVHTPQPAVRAGRIVTGRSAGHAVAFALEILRGLKGDEVAAKVRHAMYLD